MAQQIGRRNDYLHESGVSEYGDNIYTVPNW